MKLWIAAFFAEEVSPRICEDGFLVSARDPSECAWVAESFARDYPALIGSDAESFVSYAIDLNQAVVADRPAVLYGSFPCYGTTSETQIYWRRDKRDAFWVNLNEMREGKNFFDCVWHDPRGWPAYGDWPRNPKRLLELQARV